MNETNLDILSISRKVDCACTCTLLLLLATDVNAQLMITSSTMCVTLCTVKILTLEQD